MTRRPGFALLTVVALVAAGCTPVGSKTAPRAWSEPGRSMDASAAVSALPVEQLAGDMVSRAAEGIVPPTNRWHSGLVFGDAPHRVYPFPLALDARTDSFTVSLPVVTVSATTIEAGAGAGVAVGVPADAFTVVRADPVSVTARYTSGGETVGDLTVAEGWPVVAFTAAHETALAVAAEWRSVSDGVWATSIDGLEYGVRAPGASLDAGQLCVPAGGAAQWFAVPVDSEVSAWAAALGDPVSSVSTAFSTSGGAASTRLAYEGTDATVLVPFPGHVGAAGCDLGTFATAYGIASACAATALEWSVPRLEPTDAYDFTALAAEERASLVAQVRADFAATEPVPGDTYFGGKALARLAALLSLARSLAASELADRIADRLETELHAWTDAAACADRCFVYDDALRLVVSRTPSFGAEEGNDHHFHYGYFLAAAAALAEARPSSVEELAPVMDALAADIAAGTPDEALPRLRVFDPYRGHSWASGPSPFASGNNQESSSEAVAAWNGLALWARARGDAGLEATATWMLSAEAGAARSLWVEPDLTQLPEGYAHGIVSLTWSGKRDYATWFSAEPSAILGIQVLPIGPISLDYLARDPARVAQNVAEAGGDAAFAGPLGEYVLAYSALAGADARAHAEEIVGSWAAPRLDDGTSLSALRAWLAAVRLAQSAAP